MKRRNLVALAAATAVGVVSLGSAGKAQGTYPERPITLVLAAPAELDRFVRNEGETWSKLIRDNKITMAE